ncbi:MAG: RimK family alpha-L-glutamate ligase [Clostridia bacterium]|nr:RimK family alpha-L-glutamate ligase [Clostridia bacterium]
MRGKVLVVYDDSIGEEEFISKNKLLIDAAKENNITLAFKSNSDLYTYIDNNNVKGNDTYGTYNYCLFFNKDAYLAKNLEMMGVKVVNCSKAINLCENKANMYQELTKTNINIPKTVIFPTHGTINSKKTADFLQNAINDLGLPVVVKGFFGGTGNNVYLARTKEQLMQIVEKMNGFQVLIQEYILESSGTDIRVFVIKNKVIAAIRRQGSAGDFRSNVGLGGSMTKHIPTYTEEQLAINAAKQVGCDFAIVDILKSINGPVVCEVNTTANVNNFYKICDVNIPELLFKTIK